MFFGGDQQQQISSPILAPPAAWSSALLIVLRFDVTTRRQLEAQCSHFPYGLFRVLDSCSDCPGLWFGIQTIFLVFRLRSRLVLANYVFTGLALLMRSSTAQRGASRKESSLRREKQRSCRAQKMK
jgi:hypothetical protein